MEASVDEVAARCGEAVDRAELLKRLGDVSSGDNCMASEVGAVCLQHPDSYSILDAALDVVWERLNTGHWRAVDSRWRELYGLISVARVLAVARMAKSKPSSAVIDATDVARDLIKMCDMGLLLGEPVLNDACGKMAESLSDFLLHVIPESDDSGADDCSPSSAKRRKISVPSSKGCQISELETVDCPSLEDFIDRFKSSERPILIDGMMSDWPCMSGDTRWSTRYLKKIAGARTVPVEIGSRYTDDSWTQKLMTVDAFVETFMRTGSGAAGAPVGYLAQHNLLNQVSRLKEDIVTPDFCYSGEEDGVDINAWFGPAGTVSPLHTDPKHNLLCQVFGSKYVRLYPKSETEKLYPHDDLLLFNTSRVDLEAVDEEEFPDFKKAQGFECVLGEGQMLYIPPKCWHFVKSMSPSCSLSFWFQ